MLKGVCVCTFECVRRLLCKWGGKLYALEIWEVRAFFYGHFMLREGLFMAAGYCFLQVWLLLLERGIKRAESGGDYTSLCCASIWGDHLSRVHSQRRDLVKPRGTQCPCYLGDRLHKHKHRHINTCVLFLCAKTLTCRNAGADAQSKTCTLVRTYGPSDSTPGDPSDLHFQSRLHCRFSKTLMSTPDWIYDSSIPRYLRWSKLSPHSVCWENVFLPYRI